METYWDKYQDWGDRNMDTESGRKVIELVSNSGDFPFGQTAAEMRTRLRPYNVAVREIGWISVQQSPELKARVSEINHHIFGILMHAQPSQIKDDSQNEFGLVAIFDDICGVVTRRRTGIRYIREYVSGRGSPISDVAEYFGLSESEFQNRITDLLDGCRPEAMRPLRFSNLLPVDAMQEPNTVESPAATPSPDILRLQPNDPWSGPRSNAPVQLPDSTDKFPRGNSEPLKPISRRNASGLQPNDPWSGPRSNAPVQLPDSTDKFLWENSEPRRPLIYRVIKKLCP